MVRILFSGVECESLISLSSWFRAGLLVGSVRGWITVLVRVSGVRVFRVVGVLEWVLEE